MNILNLLRQNIFLKKLITHVTLFAYLLTIFMPTIATAGTFEISFEQLKEPQRLAHNQEFEHQLGKVLQKRISEAKEVRAGAGALGGVAGYESDGDARSVDSGYVSDSTRSIMTARKPRGGAGYESEDGYASDASELSRYGAGSERHLKATTGAPHKVQRVSFKYRKGNKEVWATRTIFTGQESFKVMGDYGCLEFAIVDGQVHLKSFKGPELKVKSPRLGIHIDRYASILADRVSIASRMGVLNGRIEGGNVQWSGLEAEPYGSRAQLLNSLGILKEMEIRNGIMGRSTPLSNQVFGEDTLDRAYCSEKRSYRRVDPHKLYNGLTLAEYIKANPPKKPQPQPLDLRIGSFGAMKAEGHLKLDNVGSLVSSGFVDSRGDLHVAAATIENHGTISGQGNVQVVATKIDNSRGTIRGQGRIEVGAQEIDNQDGKIEGKNLTVKTHILNNERGKIVGAKSTNVIMGRTDTSTPSTFKNLLGEIGAIGSKTILTFLTQAIVTTLGLIRGFKIHIADESGSDTLTLQNGALESMALRPEAGGAVDYGTVHIQAKRFHAPKVKFLVDTLYAKVTDLHLGTQDSLGRLVITVPTARNFQVTHPIRTAGTLEFWEEDFTREDEVQEAMERIYGKDGLIEAAHTHTIHIDADVQAKDLRIFAPYALLRFGEQKEGKPIPTIDLQQGNLTTYLNTFDLENAFLAAFNAFVHAPMGIRIGRLIRDITRDNFATFYAHSQCSTSFGLHWFQSAVYNYMGKRLQDVFDGRQFVLRMPVTISNGAKLDIEKRTTLKGPLRHQGELETDDLDLESSKESVFEVAIARIKRNFTINGLRLLLSPIIGTLDLCYDHRDYEYKFVGSDPSELWVGGEIKTDSTPILKNLASILKARSIATSIGMEGEDFDSSMYQKFLQPNIYDLTPIPFQETCMATNGGYGGVGFFRRDVHGPRRFLQYTNNFADAQKHFSYKTETDEAIILHPSLAKGRGHLSALAVLAFVGEEDFSLGSFNPYYTPPSLPSPIGNLMAKPFNHMSVNVLKDFTELMMGSAMRQSLFGFREFRYDEAKAQAFCAAIQDYQVLITPTGPMQRSGHGVYALSPKLLLERVQRECMDKLNRSNIYHGKPMDETMLIEMHKNALEYFESYPASDQSMALVLRSEGVKLPKLTKPAIFYKEEVNEHGITVLTAFPVFPIHMIEEVHGKGNGYIFAQIVGIFPKSMSPMHLLEFFRDMPAIGRQVARILLPDAIVDPLEDVAAPLAETGATAATAMVPFMSSMLAARGGTGDMPTMPSTGGKSFIHADVKADRIVIIATDAVEINGSSLKAKDIFISSLNDAVHIISEKKRLGGGDCMWEEIDRRASLIADEYLTIFAGKDIVMQGVKTQSGIKTHMHAVENIYDEALPLLWQRIEHHYSKKRSSTTVTSGTHHVVPEHASKQIELEAGGDIFGWAHRLEGEKAILTAGKSINLLAVNDITNRSTRSKRDGGWSGRSITSTEQSSFATALISQYDVRDLVELVAPLINWESPSSTAAQVNLITPDGEGAVNLRLASNTRVFADSRTSSTALSVTSKGGQSYEKTPVEGNMPGRVNIHAREAFIEGIASRNLDLARWLINADCETHLIPVETIRQMQAVSHVGLTKLSYALIATAVVIGTGGAGGSMAVSMGAAKGGVVATMASAGVSAVAAQYAVNMASTRGDVGASAKRLTTRESVRSTAISMVTAGLAKGLGKYFGKSVDPSALSDHATDVAAGGEIAGGVGAAASADAATTAITMDKIREHATNASIYAGSHAASTIVIGGERPRDVLREIPGTIVAATAGAIIANKIGEWYYKNPDAYILHKLAHAATGAGMAAIRGGDERSMLSGAAGAVMAEMLMEAMIDKDRLMADGAGGVGKVTDESLVYNPVTGAIVPIATVEGIQFERNLAHILGAATGALLGGDFDMASLAASNAIDNNFFLVAALLALEGISLYDAYEEGGTEGVAQQFRRDREIVLAMGGAPVPVNGIKVVGKYGKRVYGAVKGLGRAGAGTEAVAGGAGVVKAVTGGSERAVATLSKEQPWTVRPGQEWKLKVIGRAQKTGTVGHDVRSYREAVRAAKSTEVESVFLNRGMRKASGHPIARPNTRPDVTIVGKDGRIHQIEVPSRTDVDKVLQARMDATRARLPERMQGETDIMRITITPGAR